MTSVHTETIGLKAADGHRFDALRAAPRDPPLGAVVIVQEIFGVNHHIQAVAHQYADAGFLAIAPALFDRIERRADVPYSDVARGRALKDKLLPAQALLDLKATIDAVADAGQVGLVGYCWGATMAYLAACHLSLAASVCYYGAGIAGQLDRTPKCPVTFHFGERDASIPPADIEKIKKAYPLGHYYHYPADHGFNCTERASYDAPSATLALQRSLEFLHRHVG